MKKQELKRGDVVQVRPKKEGYGGCLVIVDEPKSFGCQGFILLPGEFYVGNMTALDLRVYVRIKFEDMEYIGHAKWIDEPIIKSVGKVEDTDIPFYDRVGE